MSITSKADIRLRFFRYLGIEENDGYAEDYDEDVETTVDSLIQEGLWNAQYWMLTNTPIRRWLVTTDPLTFTTDAFYGTSAVNLPTDFIRIDGDDDRSGLFDEHGRRWGHRQEEAAPQDSGNIYWIENDQLVLGKNSTKTSGLRLKYFARHADLTEDGTIDFPLLDRALIAAEAASLAVKEAWTPLEDPSTKISVEAALKLLRSNAASRARSSREATKFRRPRPRGTGTKFFH